MSRLAGVSAKCFCALLFMVAMAGATPATEIQTGLSTIFKQVITESNETVLATPTANLDWQNLPGATGKIDSSFALIVDAGTLVTVRFSAESLCAGGGTDMGVCAVRILIDEQVAKPVANDFAFDSTNNGARGSESWQALAMERTLCVLNPDGANRLAPVLVQWSLYSDDADYPTFRLDDWTLTIESSPAVVACESVMP